MKVVYFFLLVTTFIPSFTKNGIKANIITMSQSVNDNCVTLNIWAIPGIDVSPTCKIIPTIIDKIKTLFLKNPTSNIDFLLFLIVSE